MTPRYITVKGGGISASTAFYIGHVQHDRTMSRREAYEYLSQQTGFRPALPRPLRVPSLTSDFSSHAL